ncbi:MAG: PLP-dependent aminotransferase family protein [Adlercreutzia sp.]|uniref:aminotransferase-like domain-containing protein n=1 Tax=uncultured Adlercreutzia sp. TaxID=875803 RepID=UPI00216D4ABF|nr:PLP-dependent aminotransferase family protein [uncultured Adlercreutzia sp.]MCI8424336.1 PLP-dependent aminotransferase family protein [Adlercreutzia sp.]
MSSAHITFDTTGDKIARRVRKMRSSAVRDLFAAATREDVISLSGGMPAVSLLPPEDVRAATLAAVDSPEARALSLQYGPTNGAPGLRAVLADMMRDLGIRVKADEILVTTGAQEALSLIAEAFIDPGDIIITEGPTYLGALQAFSAFEPDVRAIPFDEEGMRMDLLEAELERIGKGNPRLKYCYVIPNFQNPGGVTMTAERRRRLLQLAHEYNFMVVEDDPYGRLRYDGGHQVPLKAMDDNVIYLGTISKMLGPGLRTGWIAAPEAVLARINLVKQGADLCGSSFDQLIVQHYFTDVNWQRTLQKFVQVYKERRDTMLAALEEFFPPEATWTHPEGGMFLWVTLPDYMDTDSMLAEALEAGVTYVPGNSFFPDGKTGRNSMRVNFSFEEPASITEAIRRLAGVIEERLELYRVFINAGALPGYGKEAIMADEKTATPWSEIIADSEQNEEAVMQAREGDAAQIDIAEEKTVSAQEAAAPAEEAAGE